MFYEVTLPSLSPTMEEGKIVKWLKKEKDSILSGEVIFEVETDKATMEYESPEDGFIASIIVKENSIAKVNEIVAIISDSIDFKQPELIDYVNSLNKTSSPKGNENPTEQISQIKFSKNSNKEFGIQITPLAKRIALKNNIDLTSIKPTMRRIRTSDLVQNISLNTSTTDRVFISPYARKLADNDSIDLKLIKGTGPLNRIISRDIINRDMTDGNLQINKLRQAIAKATLSSKQNIPHFYLNSKVNMNEVLSFRKKEKQKGNKYSFNAILMNAISKAFKSFPNSNCTYKTNGEFIINSNHNIGIAVDSEAGLKMPVLKNIEKNNLDELNNNLNRLISITRDNKLTPSDLSDGVISISNLGSYNIRSFDAIILPGQTYILAVGQIFEDVYVNKGKIEIASFVNLTLSCDHRAVDGVLASQFFSSLVQNLEKISNE
jgi:pyruvate dehydrogenase E2 component (dihydrolipoamide acetyltransferase)